MSLAAALPITAGLVGTNHVNINNKQNLKIFDGHFPGMGPYGAAGNQDHAWGSSNRFSVNVTFDLSTTSIRLN